MLASCNDNIATKKHLRDVESFINERPDSALLVLREISPRSLSTKYLRAYSSLLHSQALDKCYIDLKTDSIIAPAVIYYSRRGCPDHRLKMCYYRARVFQNADELDSAMKWLVNGERFVPKCKDYTAAGRLFSVKTELYYYVYDFNKAKTNIEKAIDLYEPNLI
ncbi:MAG: hypothetical protein Q4G10_08305 [Bacteroidia bacterium]|nr:hypothetical protein [Bacteroidia bacterium]